MEIDEEDDVLIEQNRRALILTIAIVTMRPDPVPENTCPFTGKMYMNWLMNTASDNAFFIVARMHKFSSFIPLVNLLQNRGELKDTRGLCSTEKVFLFIHILGANSMRSAKARWQHSLSTISKCVHQVIDSLLKVRHLLMEKPSSDESVHPSIADNPKFAPFFNNCIGATDGSLIPAIIPTYKQGPWRDRKGNITQNVLIVANFDLLYTYALCGWEGSAPDQRVLEDSYNKSFHIPANKFILADAAFTLCPSVLTPYRGVRYHLKEWAKGNRKPANARELFNLRHASLRNLAERVLGITKEKFPILATMMEFKFQTQRDIVLCCLLLHNFIRKTNIYDEGFDYQETEDEEEEEEENLAADEAVVDGVLFRDNIANEMWDQYVAYCLANA